MPTTAAATSNAARYPAATTPAFTNGFSPRCEMHSNGTRLSRCPNNAGVQAAVSARSTRTVGWNTLSDALKPKLATASTHPYQICTCHTCSSPSLLLELLGKPD